MGRLTRDPELRTTSTGKSVVSFSIAVDSPFKDEQGEKKTSFFRVSAWGKTAEFVSNYLNKGRLVAVDGRLESRKYTDKDGNNREVVEVVADNVQGLDRPKDDAGGQTAGAMRETAGGGGEKPAGADDYDPFAED